MIDAGYYFKHQDKLPFPELWDGGGAAYEILMRVKPVLNAFFAGKDSNVHIGEGTVIPDCVTITGPVWIGANVEIKSHVTIRPYSVISDGCAIGHGSEIKRTIMFGGSKVASLSFVGDSVLGKSARVGSGVITANRRFDQKDISIRHDGALFAIGDSYCGVILGDNARLGANCVTQPGTHIGPYTWIFPQTTVRGLIPAQKRVYHPQSVVMEDHDAVELS